MKRKLSSLLALILVAVFALALTAPALAAPVEEKKLQFNTDGKFTVLQIADTQDIFIPYAGLSLVIAKALDAVQPDLVVFTGDNIAGSGCITKGLAELAIDAIVAPVAQRNIPFTVIFGNHDDEGGVSKETQLEIYQKYANCLAYDADPALYGCGTHNLPILGADGSRNAYNLWLVDSNTYDRENGGYDYVHEDQIAWYRQQSNALKAENGGIPLPSMAFQHIAVPEIYECLKEAPAGTEGARERFGKNWLLELNPAVASGALGEWPCPPDSNHGEFEAMRAQGDVVAMVFGHDHVNDFIGKVRGIDLIQSPGTGYASYGDDTVRGVRVITLDENNTGSYETKTIKNTDLIGKSFGSGLINLIGSTFLGHPLSLIEFIGKIIAKIYNAIYGVVALVA